MAQSPTRAAASELSKGAKSLTETARKIRALDALGSSLTTEQKENAFSKVIGELRAFRATTLHEVIEQLKLELPVEAENVD